VRAWNMIKPAASITAPFILDSQKLVYIE